LGLLQCDCVRVCVCVCVCERVSVCDISGKIKRKNDSTGNVILPKTTTIQRKYNPDYIRFGFVNGGDVVEPRAQCVECVLKLSNEALKPSNLKRHLETRHPALTYRTRSWK